MQGFFGSIDRSIHDEFRYIATYISQTRDEIAAFRPNDIKNARLPTAGAELEAIVKNTEDATNTIMAAAEQIMSADIADDGAYRRFVNAKMVEVFEACSFQDITGQRVRKVVDTLRHIEERVTRFAHVMGVKDAQDGEASPEDSRRAANLLNGPALNGPETSQRDIDAMFANQADIDKMFG